MWHPTPPLFSSKCSFCESCTRGFRELEVDDWERFGVGKELTQSAQRHRERGKKGDSLQTQEGYGLKV